MDVRATHIGALRIVSERMKAVQPTRSAGVRNRPSEIRTKRSRPAHDGGLPDDQPTEAAVIDMTCPGGLHVELSRRDLLKYGLLGSAAMLLPLERVARTQLLLTDRMPERTCAATNQ